MVAKLRVKKKLKIVELVFHDKLQPIQPSLNIVIVLLITFENDILLDRTNTSSSELPYSNQKNLTFGSIYSYLHTISPARTIEINIQKKNTRRFIDI